MFELKRKKSRGEALSEKEKTFLSLVEISNSVYLYLMQSDYDERLSFARVLGQTLSALRISQAELAGKLGKSSAWISLAKKRLRPFEDFHFYVFERLSGGLIHADQWLQLYERDGMHSIKQREKEFRDKAKGLIEPFSTDFLFKA